MEFRIALSIPIGRIEFLGQVLDIVEHDGRLVAACTDDHGLPAEALTAPHVNATACRHLMRDSIDLLLAAGERAFSLRAQQSTSCGPACIKLHTPAVSNPKSKIQNPKLADPRPINH